MSKVLQFRSLSIGLLIACSALLLTAIYIEPFASMEACPMCMMQRAVYVLIGSLALIALIHNPLSLNGQRLYLGLFCLSAIGGMYLAGRQIWLQHLPPDLVPACGPPLDYMLDVFPLLEVLQMALTGTGDCAKVQWQFLGLSIPGWSFVAFTGFLVSSLIIAYTESKKASH